MLLQRLQVRLATILLLGTAAGAQVTQRVSVASTGAQGNDNSNGFPSLSADGRCIAFFSGANNLVPGDTNSEWDVFVHDRQTGVTSRVSVDSSGAQADGHSQFASISADGRYVAYDSLATNLVPGDTNGSLDVFVHDRQTGATTRVSVTTSGAQGNWESFDASISADGRYVTFQSNSNDLVVGDTNFQYDVFVHELETGVTSRVSINSFGAQAIGASYEPAISADGRYVAFKSYAQLVNGDTNTIADIFVHDRQTGVTSRVSVDSSGAQTFSGAHALPSISGDGRYVAFASTAKFLVPGDNNNSLDIFFHDRQTGSTIRASLDSSGVEGNAFSFTPYLSTDGRFVTFYSWASNLVSGDNNNSIDIFVHEFQTGVTTRVNVDSSGAEANGHSLTCSLSSDGRYVAFMSDASNLVSGDTNNFSDIFVHDRDAMGFASLCEPNVAGVIGCPCGNSASGPGRGCDNSASTGGASLSASGVAYLSMDSLVFTTSDEMPTATSIVLQGNAELASGVVFGQGVRCAGGMLLRLYVKAASAGSITAPDFGASDPSVSARSAALGDMIQAGESRWYLVYYRDPVVVGGCPTLSTFNATQTGRISWSL